MQTSSDPLHLRAPDKCVLLTSKHQPFSHCHNMIVEHSHVGDNFVPVKAPKHEARTCTTDCIKVRCTLAGMMLN